MSPAQIASLGPSAIQAFRPELLSVLSRQQINSFTSDQVQQFSLAQFQAMVPAELVILDNAMMAALIPDAKRDLLQLAAVAREYAGSPDMDFRQANDLSRVLVAFIQQLQRSEDFRAAVDVLPWDPKLADMRYGAWPAFPGMQFELRQVAEKEEKEGSPLVRLAEDLGGYFAKKKAEGLFSVAAAKLAVQRTIQSRAVRVLIESSPIVGNLLSLYTATTGQDPLTGEAVGDADRALAVLGTIPGGGALLRVAGASSINVVRRVLSSSVGQRLQKAKDAGETAKELVEIFMKFSENVDESNSPEIIAVANSLFQRLLKPE